jgi:hypothetical protein
MAAIATNTLLEEVKCYACYGGSTATLLKLALLRRLLLGRYPNADVTGPGLLAYAKCYACYGASVMELLELALLDQISQ